LIADRIYQAINIHREAGVEPRTVVVNNHTLWAMIRESSVPYADSMLWIQEPAKLRFLGLGVEVRDFMPDGEVIIGV